MPRRVTEPTPAVAGGPESAPGTVEVDVGPVPVFRGKLTITDPAIEAGSIVQVWQASAAYTGKGTLADEAEMDPIRVVAVYPTAGSAVVVWETCAGVFLRDSGVPQANRVGTLRAWQDERFARASGCRLGLVKGNVKFNYKVA